MFNPTAYLIDALVDRLQQAYRQAYGNIEPEYPDILSQTGRMALANIAGSDALYHNVEHTIMVTLVGQDILWGKHLLEGDVTPQDWLYVVLALLCHDIGYVRGVCREDGEGSYITGVDDHTVALPETATDASLTPYHVDCGKHFIRERFGGHTHIDAEMLATYIERTRFPVPNDDDHQGTADYPGLVRAADLIGQLADPRHLLKLPALFYEFEETGTNATLGYTSPRDLRDHFPTFYWQAVHPYIQDALRYLRVTQEGHPWIANLYAHVFAVENRLDGTGKRREILDAMALV